MWGGGAGDIDDERVLTKRTHSDVFAAIVWKGWRANLMCWFQGYEKDIKGQRSGISNSLKQKYNMSNTI